MQKPKLRAIWGSLSLPAALLLSSPANADLISNSTASLSFRNYFFSRDFRSEDVSQSRRQEWAQGIMLNARSGYTEGVVGFGVDVYAALGMKLDSSDAHAGTGLLPNKFGDSGPEEYTDLSGALKMKIANTQIMAGGFQPRNPILLTSDARLLPPIFNGYTLNSTDIENLTVDAGQFRSVNYRNSSGNHDDFRTGNYSATSDQFNYGGLTYKLSPEWTAAAWRGELKDVYEQNYAGITMTRAVGSLAVNANVGYFSSSEAGGAKAGNIDNGLTTAFVSAAAQGHSIRLGYQDNSGGSPFPYLQDSDPNVVNGIQILDFTRAEERSWQGRYDFDFVTLGIPGLTFFTRYVRGNGFEVAGRDGKEWERNIDLSYVVQSGPLKNLGFRWRNAMVRSDASVGDLDENRLILSYTLPLR